MRFSYKNVNSWLATPIKVVEMKLEQGDTGLKHESKERMLSNSMIVVWILITRGIDPRASC